MRRSITAILLAFAALGGLVAPAHAGSISGTLSGDAVLTPTNSPGVYIQNYTGAGDDTVFGSSTAQSTSTIDFSNPPAITISSGMISQTFSSGTLFGTGSGSGTASGTGTATVTLDFVITGGTDFFAGATGQVTITAMITRTGATTESITGTYSGSLLTVPEPSTLVLLAPSVVCGAVVAFRRRRRESVER
jgi:hypothetical protein